MQKKWQKQNSKPITIRRFFFFGEIAHGMGTLLVNLTKDVEHERINIKIESFVIKKQFCHETQVLAVELVLVPINFEDWKCSFPVNLFTRRLPDCALACMISANQIILSQHWVFGTTKCDHFSLFYQICPTHLLNWYAHWEFKTLKLSMETKALVASSTFHSLPNP